VRLATRSCVDAPILANALVGDVHDFERQLKAGIGQINRSQAVIKNAGLTLDFSGGGTASAGTIG
jgi:hypothetical protein